MLFACLSRLEHIHCSGLYWTPMRSKSQQCMTRVTFLFTAVFKQQGFIWTMSRCVAQVRTCCCIVTCCIFDGPLVGVSGRLGAGELFGFLVGRHSLSVSWLWFGRCKQALNEWKTSPSINVLTGLHITAKRTCCCEHSHNSLHIQTHRAYLTLATLFLSALVCCCCYIPVPGVIILCTKF